MEDRNRIDNYRNRAEEIRVLAEAMKVDETRMSMLGIAEDYLRMADRLEKRLEFGPEPPKTQV